MAALLRRGACLFGATIGLIMQAMAQRDSDQHASSLTVLAQGKWHKTSHRREGKVLMNSCNHDIAQAIAQTLSKLSSSQYQHLVKAGDTRRTIISAKM